MNKLPLNEGRIKQKLKTRESIMAAAKRLMKISKKVSLEDVAKEAKISRATIYRYFSNIDLLIMEATLDIQHPSAQELVDEVQGLRLPERIFYIQHHYNTLAQKNENGFRRYLSAALAESVTKNQKVRGARRVESLRKSLEPFKKQLSKKDYDNLINIASLLMGIDALIVTKDVCGLDNRGSSELLKWGMEMLIKGMDKTTGD
jgi:AcrR family transcriptional regulator